MFLVCLVVRRKLSRDLNKNKLTAYIGVKCSSGAIQAVVVEFLMPCDWTESDQSHL